MYLHGRKKKAKALESFDINVTPMIDMFSVLISFLLMTAVFSATGQIKIEVPFLSSKPPPPQKEIEAKPKKTLTVIVDNTEAVLEVGSTASSASPEKYTYKYDERGFEEFQSKLYFIRTADATVDLATVMTELDVPYETLVKVLDAMRELRPGRQPIPMPADYKVPSGVDKNALIPKIVLGNIIL